MIHANNVQLLAMKLNTNGKSHSLQSSGLSLVPSYIADTLPELDINAKKFYAFRNPYKNNTFNITFYASIKDCDAMIDKMRYHKGLLVTKVFARHNYKCFATDGAKCRSHRCMMHRPNLRSWIYLSSEPTKVYECLVGSFNYFKDQVDKMLRDKYINSISVHKTKSKLKLTTDLAPCVHAPVFINWLCKIPLCSIRSIQKFYTCYTKTLQPLFSEFMWRGRPRFVDYVINLKNQAYFSTLKTTYPHSIYQIMMCYFKMIETRLQQFRELCFTGALNSAIELVSDQNNFITACQDTDITFSFIMYPCFKECYDYTIIKIILSKITPSKKTQSLLDFINAGKVSVMEFCQVYDFNCHMFYDMIQEMYDRTSDPYSPIIDNRLDFIAILSV